MLRRLNLRLVLLLLLLAGLAAGEIAREFRPSLLRPGTYLYAYVANAGDGTISVIDLKAMQLAGSIKTHLGPETLAFY